MVFFSRTGAKQVAKGSAVLNDPFDPLVPGELVVNFEEQPAFSKFVALKWKSDLRNNSTLFTARARSTNYNIIDTDYENFSIVYSCNNIGFLKNGKISLASGLLCKCHSHFAIFQKSCGC